MKPSSFLAAATGCLVFAGLVSVAPAATGATSASETVTGSSVFTGYAGEHPGIRRKITVADLPEPYATKSVDNGAHIVPRPQDAWPQAPAGFKVSLYADRLEGPRLIRFAPNGDLFVAESEAGKIKILRGIGADGKAKQVEVFASGLTLPFGINFYPSGPNPKWVYVANTNSVVRFPYHNGDLKARGPAEIVTTELPGYGRLRGGGHWTRDVVFSRDGKHMFVSVGSHSNDDDPDTTPQEHHRADVLEFTPQGKFERVYAYGIRNCVGEAISPVTGDLWCSTNERDGLGNNLVPDYITHVQEGGFYGWPWFYIGGHQDPRQQGKHPELKSKVIVPDVLLQPHFASLEMQFYEGSQFPSQYHGWAFAAEHGSWNREPRAGYEVITVPIVHGRATGEYEDFLTGFVLPGGKVWGRPVGVAFDKAGSLFVADDGSNSIWHVTYTGDK
jgi:glucose/arabinose dehydrogenase